MLIFLVGSLLGVLMGGALCVRYLRREVAADIGPKLKHMQLQLDNIETELNLAIVTRHAELTARSPASPHASCRQRTTGKGPRRPGLARRHSDPRRDPGILAALLACRDPAGDPAARPQAVQPPRLARPAMDTRTLVSISGRSPSRCVRTPDSTASCRPAG